MDETLEPQIDLLPSILEPDSISSFDLTDLAGLLHPDNCEEELEDSIPFRDEPTKESLYAHEPFECVSSDDEPKKGMLFDSDDSNND